MGVQLYQILPEVSGILRLNYLWHEADLILADQCILFKCIFMYIQSVLYDKECRIILVCSPCYLVVVAADLFCWCFIGLVPKVEANTLLSEVGGSGFPAWKGWNENGHNQWELPLQLEDSSDPMTLFLDETLLYHMLYSSRKETVPMFFFGVSCRKCLDSTRSKVMKLQLWLKEASLKTLIEKQENHELLAPERRRNGWRSFFDAAGNPRGSQGRDSGPSLDQT